MALAHNPRIVTDGLVLCLDAANPKSYPGSGTTVTDISGSGYSGTLGNGTAYNSANNGYFDFDGTNDWIGVSTIDRTTTATLEILFNTDSVSTNQTIRQYLYTQQQKPPSLAQYTYMERQGILIAGNIIQGQYFNTSNSASAVRSSTVISSGVWYLATLVINGTDNKLYVNGALESTNTEEAKATTVTQGRIGRRDDSQGEDWLNGKIACVREYNKALTADEVAQNFVALRGRFGI